MTDFLRHPQAYALLRNPIVRNAAIKIGIIEFLFYVSEFVLGQQVRTTIPELQATLSAAVVPGLSGVQHSSTLSWPHIFSAADNELVCWLEGQAAGLIEMNCTTCWSSAVAMLVAQDD